MIKISYSNPEDGLPLSVVVNDEAIKSLGAGSSYHSLSERHIYISVPLSLSEEKVSEFIDSIRNIVSDKFKDVLVETNEDDSVSLIPPVFGTKS